MRLHSFHTGLALAAAGLAMAISATASDWPSFRHDPQLSGRSPLRGGFASAPAEVWAIDLGAGMRASENLRAVDLDGDGLEEFLSVRRDSLVCLGRDGETRWTVRDLPGVQVVDIRDFAGDGTKGILVGSSNGLESVRWMVSGTSGTATPLYRMRDVFGYEERVGKILPGVPGIQFCAWWSGDSPEDRFGGVMAGEGYLYSFENGVDTPVARFEQQLEGVLYKPRHLFADYDADGATEMVMVSHQQAWFFNVAENTLELNVEWPMIRTYSALLAMRPGSPGALPSLFSINPHIPGVERVDIVDGTARVAWRYVAGGRADQYQTDVRIAPGAPDPFIPLFPDNRIGVFVQVENEHGDGKPWLVLLDGRDGAKHFEAPDLTLLGYDDLNGDGVVELLLQAGDTLRIANWADDTLVDIGRAANAAPVLEPLPPEGDLTLSHGGNARVRRIAPEGPFLLRFADGIFACTLDQNGIVRGGAHVEAVPNDDPAPETHVSVVGNVAHVLHNGAETFRLEPALERQYLAPPAVVADLGGTRRVLARSHDGALVSWSAMGDDARVLAARSFGDVSVYDMDGDGNNEAVVGVTDDDGAPACVFLDATGAEQRRFGLIDNATALTVGPSGALGPGRGRWLAIYYTRGTGNRNGVAAYDGQTGARMWLRDDYQTPSGAYGAVAKVKFVLHIPTAVYDFDADGADDLLAASENFYGVLSVVENADLAPVQVFSDYIPGHWQAYASPIAADFLGLGRPQVFHHRAFANTVLTDLAGQPIWHWGTSRDRTAASWPGIADLDGNGTLEVVQTRVDGLLRAFEADPGEGLCPKCPPDAEQTAMNRTGVVRWEMAFTPPISDLIAADVNGDGNDEVLFGAGDGHLYALGETAGAPSVVWSWDAGRIVGSPVIAALGDAGIPSILVPTEDGYLRCLQAG